MQLSTLPPPRFRGWLHHKAFFASIPAGLALVALAQGAEGRVGALIFAASLSGVFGVSAAYHRGEWSARAKRVMKHLDHSMIFVFIAGSYTPVTLVALHPPWGTTLLVLAWLGAVAGVVVTVLFLERWSAVAFAMYLVLGWLAVIAAPALVEALTRVEMGLLVTGGLLYTIGAIILAGKRPDPHPAVFGYHEVWHSFVVGASACHFALVLLLVQP